MSLNQAALILLREGAGLGAAHRRGRVVGESLDHLIGSAWIVEKFRAWSDCGGDIERRFSKDTLLTNVMLYWVTGAINSSFWPYYARLHDGWPIPDGARVAVPTAHASFPREMLHPPRKWAERVYQIRRWTPMPAGGHFAALEEPEALAADIRAFFRDLS